MKALVVILCLLATGCGTLFQSDPEEPTLGYAGPVVLFLDRSSNTDEQRRMWRVAAQRWTAASGVQVVLIDGDCKPTTPGCVGMVDRYDDEHRIGQGGSLLVTGDASAMRKRPEAETLATMVHEIGHALVVQHVENLTVMNPTADGGRSACIGRPELTQLCAIHKCGQVKAECDGGELRLHCKAGDKVCEAVREAAKALH